MLDAAVNELDEILKELEEEDDDNDEKGNEYHDEDIRSPNCYI